MNHPQHHQQAATKLKSRIAMPPLTMLLEPHKNPIDELPYSIEKQREALLDVQQTLRPFEHIKKAELLPDVKPFAHQKRVVNKFLSGNIDGSHNVLVAHGVGSGKTLTSLYATEEGRKKGVVNTTLVVVPASLRNNFLENGVSKFTDAVGTIYGNKQELKAGTHSDITNPPKADYHIVSIEMFRKQPEAYIRNTRADTLILDEAHKYREESGLTFDAIKKVRPLFRNFIGLTGSFISNTPSDLVPLISIMTNGHHKLGDRRSFERKFISTDENGKKILKNTHILLPLIRPYIDYFGSDELEKSQIPQKQVQEIYVEMSPEQHDLFKHVIGNLDKSISAKLHEDIHSLSEKEISHIFSKIIHARKVSNSIHTLDDRVSLEESARRTPKVKRLLDDVQQHINEHKDAQVIIFTNLIHGGFDVLHAGLKDRGLEHGFFIGKKQGVTEESRQRDVEDFKAGRKKIIVLSSAGTEGLNLPNTTMFASLDSHFNPSNVLQAEARGVRAGGQSNRAPEDRKVLIRRYITISPRGIQNPVSGLFNTLRSWFWKSDKPAKKTLDLPSVDDWVLNIAKRKHLLNQQLVEQLKKTGSDSSELNGMGSLRQEYFERFGKRLQLLKEPARGKVNKQEKLFLEEVKNRARAQSLVAYTTELLQEALRLGPSDPKLLAIMALLAKKQKESLNIPDQLYNDILDLPDQKLINKIRGFKKEKE